MPSTSSPSSSPSTDLDWPPPLDPRDPPPRPSALVGARTDGELAAALALSESASEPTFVLFGSSWCSHCHEMLSRFDAVRRTAYEGFDDDDFGSDGKKGGWKRRQGEQGPIQALLSGLGRLMKNFQDGEKGGEEGGGEAEATTSSSSSTTAQQRKSSGSSGRGRFVAARVDFMQSAASHVRFTPTVSVYRGRGGPSNRRRVVVDGFHGGDAQRLADRAWLHLGGGRRRWGWC